MILAIDTATRWMGLALHDGTAVIAELGQQSINTQTMELAPAIENMLRRADITAADLKAIAVAIGPGSYTGLRVGLAVAKGISLAYQTPLIGVPTLDITAATLGELEGQLVVIAEAGRTRISAGRYEWHKRHGWQAAATPEILTWEALLEDLDGPTTFTGEVSAAAAKMIRANTKPFRHVSPAAQLRRAGYLAEIGQRRLRKQQFDDAIALAPNYLREPSGA